MALVFTIEGPEGQREASALVDFLRGVPVIAFPHSSDERGEPLALQSDDAELLELAGRIATFFEASVAWGRLRAGGR